MDGEVETYMARDGRHIAWTPARGGIQAVGRTEDEAVRHLGLMLRLVAVVSRSPSAN